MGLEAELLSGHVTALEEPEKTSKWFPPVPLTVPREVTTKSLRMRQLKRVCAGRNRLRAWRIEPFDDADSNWSPGAVQFAPFNFDPPVFDEMTRSKAVPALAAQLMDRGMDTILKLYDLCRLAIVFSVSARVITS
jgi:hypothetical protein